MTFAAQPAPANTRDRPAADKRTPSDRRRKVFQVVQIDRAGTVARGHLLNISRAGALLHSHATLGTGARIAVSTGDGARAALIIWHAGQYFGIRFVEMLQPTLVEGIVESKGLGVADERP